MSGRLFGPGAMLLLAACGQSAEISGQVVDHDGKPLAGVAVSVEKSTYAATTNESGTYTVPFAPGTFRVGFEKDGYTAASLDLDIQQAVLFPAETVELYPKPDEAGLHLVDSKGLRKLEAAKVEKMKVSEGWNTVTKLHCSGEGPSVPAGTLRLFDTSAETFMPARLGDYGLFYQPSTSDSEGINGLFKDESERIGQEQLVLRTLEAEPGRYAYVTIGTRRDGSRDVDPDAPCYPFTAE